MFFRLVDASKRYFSMFPDLMQKVQRNVNLIALIKSFPTSVNTGFDTAEEESLKVCQK